MKKLYLSNEHRKLLGVCGGLGEYFGVDPTLVRLAFIFLALVTAVLPMGLMYLIAWAVMPDPPSAASTSSSAGTEPYNPR